MSANTNAIQQLYVAYFGRPADVSGLAYWETVVAAQNGDTTAVSAAFAASDEYKAGFAGLNNDQIVNTIYNNLFHRDAEPAGLVYWSNLLTLGSITIDNVVTQVAAGAQSTDAASITQKVAAAEAFTTALDTTAEILSYSGAGAIAIAKAWLAGVYSAATETAALGTLSATVASLSSAISGLTYTLTTGLDILTGTSGNDAFYADNTVAASHTSSAADSLTSGGGLDTLKIYSDGVNADAIPTLSGNFNLWINNTVAAALDYSANTSIKGVQLDAPKVATTLTVKGQTVAYSNESTLGLHFQIQSSTDTAENVTLSKVGKAAAHEGVDFNGALVKTATITSTGGSNVVDISNTGGAIKSIVINGDTNLTSALSVLASLKSIDASAAAGNISIDTTALALATAFTFTGGSGANTLALTEASLVNLTDGSQLNGGSGAANVIDVTTAGVYTLADYGALAATKGFSIIELNLSTFDVKQLTDAGATTLGTHFISNGGDTVSDMLSNSIVDVWAIGGSSFSAAVGNDTLTLNIGKATSTGLLGVVDTVTGFQHINLTSNGLAANNLTLITPGSNNINLTGATDLTATFVSTSANGILFDAHAFTGALTLNDTGNGDTIYTGSGVTTITEISATKADTFIYLAGHTNAVTLTLGAETAQLEKITNFAVNQDILKGGLAVGAELGANATTGVIAAGTFLNYSDFLTAAESAGGVAGDVVAWHDNSGDTYLAVYEGAVANSAHIVELVGVSAVGLTTAASHTGTAYVLLA